MRSLSNIPVCSPKIMFIDEKLLLLQPGESRRYDEVSVKWLPDTDPSDIIVLKGGEEGESS